MTTLDDARPGMDPDIRPQDDLFGHMNGHWLETAQIPADRSSWGPFVMLADESEARVRAIIEDCARADPDDPNARKIGDLYAGFLDEDRVEALGTTPIADDLARVDALTTRGGLVELVGALEREGGSGFFGAYVDTDDRDSDRYLVNLMQGGLGLPDEAYYRDEKYADIRAAYVAHLARMFTLAGWPQPAAGAETAGAPGAESAGAAGAAAQRVMAVETRLAAGHWERAETRDVIRAYNLRTLAQLREAAPAFDFDAWMRGMAAPESTLAEVVVRQPSFLTHLSQTLEEVDLEDWKAWLASRVIRGAAAYLSAALVEERFDFYGRTLNGTPELRARWKRGVAFVEGAIGEAVGEIYVGRHFPPASKAQMDELVANLTAAYRQSIERLDWMGVDTKSRAYEKLGTFRPKIGYPDKFRDYSALRVEPDDLLGNARRAAAFETERQLNKIGSPVDRDEWFMLPQTVNAYYNPGTNEICFPAGILQKPFFSPEADPAENYGGIGAVIGHEIGHGFDDQGSQYDGAGNLNEWWTTQDRARFSQRSEALVGQYDAFSPRNLPDHHVNGSLTVGENIGDLGGLTIAHRAYLISLEGAEPAAAEESAGAEPATREERAGDEMTGSQRVFLSWAYVWRSKSRKEQEQQLLAIDPHSPPEFRANIVRNLDEFHDAFGTAPGDGLWLEPQDRIRIW